MKRMRGYGVWTVVVAFASTGCGSSSSGGGAPAGDPAETISSAVTFGGGYTAMKKSMPMNLAGTTSAVAVNDVGGAGEGTTVRSGSTFMIPVQWTGGVISAVNIGFSNTDGTPPTSFFAIPIADGAMQASMSLMIPAKLDDSICANLAKIKHMIRCFEQVTLPDGTTVSKAVAQKLILDCPMPVGNPGTGGSPGGVGGATGGAGMCIDNTSGTMCPNGKSFKTCYDTGAAHCWYEVAGVRFDCGNTAGCGDCNAAAQMAVAACYK